MSSCQVHASPPSDRLINIWINPLSVHTQRKYVQMRYSNVQEIKDPVQHGLKILLLPRIRGQHHLFLLISRCTQVNSLSTFQEGHFKIFNLLQSLELTHTTEFACGWVWFYWPQTQKLIVKKKLKKSDRAILFMAAEQKKYTKGHQGMPV